MTRIMISTAAGALALVMATPASAQLLGGATGQLGGGLGGTLGQLGGTVTGTLGGAGRIDVRQPRVDPDQGSVSAEADGSASAGSALDGTLDAAGRGADLGADGSASADGGASAGVDTLGTDAVRSTVGTVADTGSRIAGRARNAAAAGADAARSTAGNAVTGAAGSANAAGSAQGGLGQLALAGTAAANGGGAFAVSPGMNVTDARGRVIGTVRSVETTGKGMVRSVTVAAGDRLATLPAASFSGSGNVLASAMTRGEIESAAEQQAGSAR